MRLTRCPHCRTVFRIHLTQIKAQGGDVRCGVCHRPFNAEKHSEASAVPLLTSQPSGPGHSHVASASRRGHHKIQNQKDGKQVFERRASRRDASAALPGASYRLRERDTNVARAYAELFQPHEIAPQDALRLAESVWWTWALAATVALAVLITQTIIYFRSEIAAINAADQPYLAALCRPFGCQVGYPIKPESLFIESSEIHPTPEGKLALFVTLKNRDSLLLEYPYLEITLTDINNQPLIRRVLAPSEYLPARTIATAGFPPKGEVNISLALSSPGVNSVGYRLYIFYP